jgi:hypothetical protein
MFTLIMVDNARFAEYGKSKSRDFRDQKSGGLIVTVMGLQTANTGWYGLN